MPKSSEKEMPFLDHLEELRFRLFWILGSLFAGVLIGFAVVFNFPEIMRFLTGPVEPYLNVANDSRLAVFGVTEGFRVLMTASLLIGIVLALPVMLYHVWAFLSPGLHPNERKLAIPVLGAGGVLFLLGVTMAFKVALPLSMRFLMHVSEQFFDPIITVSGYFPFAIGFSLAFGAMFELPIVVLSLTALGVLTPRLLRRFRPHAVVVLIVTCALITPPDILSLAVMFVPVYLLYEGSVLISAIVYRRRERRIAAERLAAQE
jgi:sec-independent protein translocase protein TatC